MSFTNYLGSLYIDKTKPEQSITHTRIKCEELKVSGGAYYVSREKKQEFYDKYYEEIYMKNGDEYLTETQILDNYVIDSSTNETVNGPLLVDLDFRYEYDVKEKQHTFEQIQDMVFAYTDELKKYYIFDTDSEFDMFVMEKKNVNCVLNENDPDNIIKYTKDGIHMIGALQVDHVVQRLIRQSMMTLLPQNVFTDLPLTNDWDGVLDVGITNGKTNWQLYGSHKAHNETYKLQHHFHITYDINDGQFRVETVPIKKGKVNKNLFMRLTARYEEHPKFPINPKCKDVYDKCMQNNKRTASNPRKRIPITIGMNDVDSPHNGDLLNLLAQGETISINKIQNQQQLDTAIEQLLASFKQSLSDYDLPEIHEYVQILPDAFYKPGSHELNRKCAFALKHTDNRLFLSWIKLRSKADDFDYGTIPKLFEDWNRYFNQQKTEESYVLTKKSIIHWAKQYAPNEYELVKKKAIGFYIDLTLKHDKVHTEYDIAMVIYHLNKDEYIYVINGKSQEWYRFKNHRWILDPKGTSLRNRISTEIYHLYSLKQSQLMNELSILKLNPSDSETDKNETVDIGEIERINKEKEDFIKKKLSSVTSLMNKLKQTANKNNIMKECQDLFLDENFCDKSDENKFLVGFTNGVFDFKMKKFRAGVPEDYITMTTNYPYLLLDLDKNEEHSKMVKELHEVIDRIYPNKELCNYMWEHWASALIGTNVNQTIHFYLGNGCNGKSKITDLINFALGDYCDKASIQLITDERGKMGQASPELASLKGKRFVYMSEPRKGAVLNDGVVKELTGDVSIKARKLFQDDALFNLQCTFIACMNNLLEVKSNDDGIWRRIRLCNHESKFAFTKEMQQARLENKYVFERDDTLDERLPLFAPYFMSILIDIACKTNAKVTDCQVVLSASNEYRKNQDFVYGFLLETVEKTGLKSDKIRKNEIWNEFKRWYSNEYNTNKSVPIKSNELFEIMDKRFCPNKNNVWTGFKIRYEQEEEEDEVVDNANLYSQEQKDIQ